MNKLQRKILDSSFTLLDFQKQLDQMKNMGPISDMLKLIPGAQKVGKINIDEKQLKWIDAIIKSMTLDERVNPDVINGSRRKRIAAGSGRSVQEVNQLLNQFHQIRQMMKKIGNNKGKLHIPFGIK